MQDNQGGASDVLQADLTGHLYGNLYGHLYAVQVRTRQVAV
jgi:hypothetical protein